MKQTFTKLGGALFVLLFLVTSSAQATITATWDWTTNNPTGIQTTPQISSTIATILSSNGVALTVDATASGATLRSQEGNAQFNEKTKLYVPVVSTKDKVTFTPNSWGYGGVKIGEDDFDDTAVAREHTATADEVAQGYVVIESKGGYVNTVSVELAYMPTARTIAKWSWKETTPASISSVHIENNSGNVDSNVAGISMYVDASASGSKLKANGDNAQFNKGTILHVPVTATTDIVSVYLYPGSSYDVTVGAASTNYTVQSFDYKATAADVALGYVQITQGESQMKYLYSITLNKGNFETTTIGSTGWATFSNASATDFTNLAGVVDAYQVTGNTGSAIDKSAVTTVAANTGLLLNAAAGTYAIPLATTGTDLSGTNKLVAGTGAAVNYNDGAGFNYVLAADGANAVFQHIVSGTNGSVVVPEGKAYLALNADPGARTLSFDDETTAISEMKIMRNVDNETFYDMQGRRVAQPAKGLYIVNGRKVIVK